MSIKSKGGKSLINVALLESFRARKGGDYLDCFLPLISTCLAEDKSEKISIDTVHVLLKKNFITNIPKASVKALVKRAVKKGILTLSDGQYLKNTSEIERMHLQYKTAAKEIIKAQNELGKQFVDYAKSKYEKEYEENYFFEEYAKYLQKYLLDFVELSLEPSNGPSVIGKSSGNIEYVISNFLKDSWKKEIGFPEYVEINMRGFLLANYLGYFESNLQDRLKAFNVYFDTPLLIGVLGFDGASKAIYLKEIIQYSLNSGINLFVFDKTLDELDGILFAYQVALKSNDFKGMNPSTHSLLINKGYTVESLETARQLVKKQLSDLGLKIVETPAYNKEYQIDELKLKDYLVKEGFSLAKPSTQRDVDYVAAIHRLRLGKKIDNTSSIIPIYFTDNKGLVKASIKFFSDDEGIKNDENNIPHCVTDTFLASLILIKNPTDGIKASKKKLLADAYSSIHVNSEFWNKFYKRIDSLLERGKVDEEDYAILRFNNEMRAIIGDQRIVDESDDVDELKVFDLLKNFKEKLTHEKNQQIKAQEAQINYLDEHTRKLQDKNQNLNSEKLELMDKVEQFEKSDKALDKISSIGARVIVVILFVLIVGVSFLDSFLESLIPSLASYKSVIKFACWIISAVLLYVGFSPGVIHNSLKKMIKKFIHKISD